MGNLKGLIAKALTEQYKGSKMKSNFEESFMWQVQHSTAIADPIPAYRFMLDRKFEFDFAWPDAHVAVEVEGGVWRKGGGAHSHPTNILRDIEKGNLAARAGWRVFRFTTDMVENGEAIEFLGTIGLPKKTLA